MVLTAFAAATPGQTPPDAGALQQRIESDRGVPLPAPVPPDRAAMPAEMRPSGVSVEVRQFRFVGNTLLPVERLNAVVAEYLGRPLGFAQLQDAATAVATVYRDAGWVVRAYLPQQDIRDGIVTIQIVEAVFGGVRLDGDPPRRVSLESVLAPFHAVQPMGAQVNAEMLDRALLLADDQPGVTVTGALQAGANEGETVLVVKLADEPLLSGDVAMDNTGARSTGEQRLVGTVVLGSPFGLGDQLVTHLIHSQGSDYGRVAWTLPLGADGWRAGINASQLDYDLVAPEFRALAGLGDSSSMGLEASYPLVRSRLKNLFFNLAYDRRSFFNMAGGTTSSAYEIDALTLSLAGNLFDRWGGGGANSASLSLVSGRLDRDGSPNRAADATTTRTHGSYGKLRYAFARQQVITSEVSLFAAYSGQLANDNLDSSEKFYLGGAHGVRAYPANEGGGAHGQMLNLEARWKVSNQFTATVFHDWGEVTQNTHNDFVGAPVPNTFRLRGHGLSLAWQTPSAHIKAVWARRGGGNPNPATNGRDQDGSYDLNRWWLIASLPF